MATKTGKATSNESTPLQRMNIIAKERLGRKVSWTFKADWAEPSANLGRQKSTTKSRSSAAKRAQRLRCRRCSKIFESRAGLAHHQKRVNAMDPANKPYMCGQCGRKFVYRSGMQRYELVHLPDYPGRDKSDRKVSYMVAGRELLC